MTQEKSHCEQRFGSEAISKLYFGIASSKDSFAMTKQWSLVGQQHEAISTNESDCFTRRLVRNDFFQLLGTASTKFDYHIA